MRPILRVFFILILITFLGCKDEPQQATAINDTVVTTFYLIRHAEKDRSNPDAFDPELNQAGLGRAMHWAEILNEVPLDAIYTTDFERTTMTAAPASVKKDITVQYYDPEDIDVAQLVADNFGNRVLVVGHSNSTPALVNQLIGQEKYQQMDDYDNGSLYIVQLIGDTATDMRLVFNCHCPD